MINFPKEITSEFFEYTSQLSLGELRTAIGNVIDQTKSIGFSANLAGKIIKENEFKITSKWDIGPMVSGPLSYFNVNYPTNLNVFIYQNKNQKTHVNLLVSPNSYLPSLFVLFPICLLVLLWMFRNDARIIEVSLVIIPLIFLCPFVILTISKILKKRLRTRFVKYLDLQEIT